MKLLCSRALNYRPGCSKSVSLLLLTILTVKMLIIVHASSFPQKPANILVMGEGPERGRVKIGM